MLHGYGYYGLFKPSVGEVIRQIPKDLLEKVVAFEIIAGAIGMAEEQFKKQFIFKQPFHLNEITTLCKFY